MTGVAYWLTGGHSYLQWVIKEIVGAAISIGVGTMIFLPLAQRTKRYVMEALDPSTPGGIGDLPDSKGVSAWERLSTPIPTKGESSE